jgi:hypothetical protein
MEVSFHLHIADTLSPRENLPLPVGQYAGGVGLRVGKEFLSLQRLVFTVLTDLELFQHTVQAFALRDSGKLRKLASRISGIPAEIRTG